MKLAFVTPWYGDRIPGGAEAELRETARHLRQAGAEVEILTTCVREFSSDWSKNFHRSGVTLSEAGIPVRRFPVCRRNTAVFDAVNAKLMRNLPVTLAEEDFFLREMIRSPALCDFIAAHKAAYTAFVFIPYLFGTTYAGVQLCPEKAVLIPCLHEESYAHFRRFREVYPQAAGMLFNAKAEQQLAERLGLIGRHTMTAVTGIGMDTAISGSAERFRQKYGIRQDFILYAGRKDAGKNVTLLLRYFAAFRRRSAADIRLVLIGGGTAEIPVEARDCVHDLGFVEPQDKYDACAAALCLCQPSLHESFSLVIMESWLCRRPVLVHGGCAVTKEFAAAANGGLYFRNYPEFEGCVNYFICHPETAAQMGKNGCRYVREHFGWETVTQRYLDFFSALSGRREGA